jgi:hypothetical protein
MMLSASYETTITTMFFSQTKTFQLKSGENKKLKIKLMADTSAVKTLKPYVPNRFSLFLLSSGNCHCDCRLQEEM